MVDSLLHHPDVDLSSVTVAAMLLRKSIGSTSSGLDHTQSLIVLIVLFPAQLLTTAWGSPEEVRGRSPKALLFGDKDFAAMFGDAEDAKLGKGNCEISTRIYQRGKRPRRPINPT